MWFERILGFLQFPEELMIAEAVFLVEKGILTVALKAV